MGEQSDVVTGQTGPVDRTLQVEFEIVPACECPVATTEDVTEVHQRIEGGVCRTDLLVDDGDASVHVASVRTDVGPACSCTVFDAFDCIPQIRSTGESLRIRTFLADRETLTMVVRALRDTARTVRLLRISETAAIELEPETVAISLDSLTETQRDTIRRAVESGYYSTPRRTNLEDLAIEFGVSKSAVSRRLHAAENKLVGELFI